MKKLYITKLYYAILLLVVSLNTAFSQKSFEYCGSSGNDFNSFEKTSSIPCSIVEQSFGSDAPAPFNNPDLEVLCEEKVIIPVIMFRITNSAGEVSSSHWSIAKINQAFNELRDEFNENLNVTYRNTGIYNISETDLLEFARGSQTDFQLLVDKVFGFLSPSFQPVVIVFTNDILKSNGQQLGGFSFFPENPFPEAQSVGNLTMLNGDPEAFIINNPGKALIHEMGHHYGLFHTFETCACETCYSGFCSNSALPNSTSSLSGDLISDTPGTPFVIAECYDRGVALCLNPDYCDFEKTESCGSFPSFCNDLTEENGQELFENYMSYTVEELCSERFSPFQLKKMQTVILNGCREDICQKPDKPNISYSTLNYNLGETIEVEAFLNPGTRSNTGNCVSWTYENGTSTLQHKSQSLSLSTGVGGDIQQPGEYQICAVDVPAYNAGCVSDQTCIKVKVFDTCNISIVDVQSCITSDGDQFVYVKFSGENGALYDVYDTDSSAPNAPDVLYVAPNTTARLGPINNNQNYNVFIGKVDSPFCLIAQQHTLSSEVCEFECIPSNCLNPLTSCNGDGTYNIDVTFDGDPAVNYTVSSFFAGTNTEYQPSFSGTPNASGNLVTNIPIGQDVTVTVKETDFEGCAGDIKTISYVPAIDGNIIEDCGADRFYIELCIEEGELATYQISDGMGNGQLVSTDECATFGPYPSQTVVTITQADPNNATCALTEDFTFDCMSPPPSCDIANLSVDPNSIDCTNMTLSLSFEGTYSSYTAYPSTGGAIAVTPGFANSIPFSLDGSGQVTISVENNEIVCNEMLTVDVTSCNSTNGDGPTPCGAPNGIASIYWPFGENSLYQNNTCSNSVPGTACGTQDYQITCGDGCIFHGGSDYYAQDWAQSNGICNDNFYAPFDGQVIYAFDGCATSCGAFPNCGTTLFGNQVIIQSTDGNYAFRVSHLNLVSVAAPQQVKAGQLLGIVGNTGNSYGAHAHTALYTDIDASFLGALSQGIGQGVVQGAAANNHAVDFEYDCQNSLSVLSFASTGQCVAPNSAVPITFRELGTVQEVNIEICDENGLNCTAVATPYTIDPTLNQDTWTYNWQSSTIPGDYTVKIFDPNQTSNNALSIASFEISTDCSSTVSCVTPTSLTTPILTGTNINLEWTPVTGAISYTVQMKLSNVPDWTTIDGNYTSTNRDFSIAPCTGYDFRVAANCTDGTMTDFNEINVVSGGCSGPSGSDGTGGGGSVNLSDCPGDNDDDEDPVFLNCPTSPYIFAIDNAAGCTAYVNWSIPVAVDNCNVNVTQISGPTSGSQLAPGSYQVAYVAEDNNDNTETCSFTVIVEDPVSLEFSNCPDGIITFTTEQDICTASVNWSIPVATDNCEVTVTQIQGPSPGDDVAPGLYQVIYEATNNATPPETAECVFVLKVIDTQLPVINCPQDITVDTDISVCEAVLNNIAPELASDNCDYLVTWSAPEANPSIGVADASGTTFPVGVTTLTYTITEIDNPDGNQSVSCEMLITVEDTELPQITCPTSATIGTSMGGIDDCIGEYTWNHPTPTDNCGITVYNLTYTNPDGTVEGPSGLLGMEGVAVTRDFGLGTTTMLYHIEDAAGNVEECTWTVTVEDDEDPMIFCDQVFATNDYAYPTVIDIRPIDITTAIINVATSATITDINIPNLAGTHPSMGDLMVTLTSPQGTTVTLFDGLCAGTEDYNLAFDEDAATNVTAAPCSPLGGGNAYQAQMSLNAFNGENSLGEWTLTFTNNFTGACGTLTDWELQIIGNNITADGNMLQVQADPNTCAYILTTNVFDPPYSDNCENPYINHDYIFAPSDTTLAGATFPVGETVIEWKVTDQAGNTAMCNLVIEVLDTQAPIFLNCPRPDIIQDAEPGICGAYVNFSSPIAEDNCGAITVTQTDATGLSTGSVFPVGLSILEYMAEDASGNITQCSLRVIVNDTQEPVLVCPQSVTQMTDTWLCEAVVNDIAPLSYADNCGDNVNVVYQIEYPTGSGTIVASGVSDASGETFEKGTSTVTYHLEDQPIIKITEVTHEIGILNGGMSLVPYTVLTTDDYIEITNFGPASLNVSGLQVERVGGALGELFNVPDNTIMAVGDVMVIHFGNGTDDAANLFFNVPCALDMTTGAGAAYVMSFEGRVLDVVAVNGFDPIGQGSVALVTPADWSGTIDPMNGKGGVYRQFTFDNDEATDWLIADVCAPITIGSVNADLAIFPDNGSVSAFQSISANTKTCAFNVVVNDEELPYCGEYTEHNYNGATNLAVPNSITGGMVLSSTINVADSYLIGDLDVLSLLGQHPNMSELTFKLTSPEGTQVLLFSGLCAGTANFDINLDTDSIPSIDLAGCAPLGQGDWFAPQNSLCAVNTAFYGENAQGDWLLEIADTVAVNDGQLDDWALRIHEIQSYSQGDETLDNDAGVCGADFTWFHPRLIDNCKEGNIEVKYVPVSPAGLPTPDDGAVVGGSEVTEFFTVGETIVRYILTDAVGNVDSCEFLVTVQDVEDPIIVCPADIVINLDPGACRDNVYYDPILAEDNCAVVDTIMAPLSGSLFEIGTTPVVMTAVDSSGNTATCTFNVIVVEYVPTNFAVACNELINVSLASDCEAEIMADMVLEGNNYGCYEDYIIVLTALDGTPLPTSPIVTIDYVGQTINYMITDPDTDNNCWGQIFVEDKALPEFDCPADITVNCNVPTEPTNTGEPVLTSCETSITTEYNDVYTDFGLCGQPRAQIVRTWTVTDESGNSNDCIQTITIERIDIADVVFPAQYDGFSNPVFSCEDLAANSQLVQPANTGFPTVDGLPLIGGALCSVSVTHSDNQFPYCEGSYDIIRTWAIYDPCMPVAAGTNPFNFTQIIKVLDNQAPSIVCPDDMIASTDGDACTATIDIPSIGVTDACSSFTVQTDTPMGTLSSNGGTISGVEVGTYTITYTVIDNCGNSTACSFELEVKDLVAPVMVCDEITTVDVSSDGLAQVMAETFDDGSYDACGLAYFEVRRMTDNCSNPSDLNFGPSVSFCCEDVPNNPIQVQLRSYDFDGNFNDCMVLVNVNDKVPPVILICPGDQNIDCNLYADEHAAALANGEYSSLEQYGTPTFYDNCSINTTYEVTFNIDNCGAGSIIRTWTTTDDNPSNSAAICTQTITVEHESDWEVEFPADIEALCTDGALPEFGEPIVFNDECELIGTAYEDMIFTIVDDACYKIVRTWQVINWCVYDENGSDDIADPQVGPRRFEDGGDGFITYEQVIKVIDTEAPSFVVPAIDGCITSEDCTKDIILPMPSQMDDCSNEFEIDIDGDLGFFNDIQSDILVEDLAIGSYEVFYNVTDECGNFTSQAIQVEVTDCKKPTPYCANGVIVEIMQTGMIDVWANDLDNGSFDNCTVIGELSIYFNNDPMLTSMTFDCSQIGSNEVELWVEDEAGNKDFCVVNIIVQDNMNVCGNGSLVIAGLTATEDVEAVEGVEIELNGNNAAQMTTQSDGLFEFANLTEGGDYSIVPMKDVDYANGVTTYDLVLISKHILGVDLLDTPYKMIAADANNSGSVTTYDMVLLRRIILLIDTELANNTSWRFVDKAYTFPVPTNPWAEDFPEVINLNNLDNDVLGADFVAVKIGDVNNSATANSLAQAEQRTQGNIQLSIANTRFTKGALVNCVGRLGEEVEGAQFALAFDPNVLAFEGIGTNGLVQSEHLGLSILNEGLILISWNGNEATQSNDLFHLQFKALTDESLNTAIRIDEVNLKGEAYLPSNEVYGLTLDFVENTEDVVLYQNVPNPFSEQTLIGFKLPQAMKAKLSIFDVSGRTLQSIEIDGHEGLNEVSILNEDIGSTGVFYYQLETNSSILVRKMIISQ